MGMLAWVIMGLALWHYTIWLPDRFWGGIVGAFLFSIVGADYRRHRDLRRRAARPRDPRAPRHAPLDRALRDPRRARSGWR
jgi:hypothetical protein